MTYYDEGYRNGHLDAVVGIGPSIIALTSNLPEYAVGYLDGYNGQPKQEAKNEG